MTPEDGAIVQARMDALLGGVGIDVDREPHAAAAERALGGARGAAEGAERGHLRRAQEDLPPPPAAYPGNWRRRRAEDRVVARTEGTRLSAQALREAAGRTLDARLVEAVEPQQHQAR